LAEGQTKEGNRLTSGKKIKDIKRHLMLDNLDLPITVVVLSGASGKLLPVLLELKKPLLQLKGNPKSGSLLPDAPLR
jgi:hypothetical protein